MGFVDYRRDGRIACLTMDRPERHNAMRDEDVLEFNAAMQRFDGDDEAFVAIVSGNGPSFCSGADVDERLAKCVDQGVSSHYRPSIEPVFYRAVNFKPVIAAVHGYALGKGMSLAMHCDLMVAAEDAQFELTEIVRGVPANAFYGLLSRMEFDAFATELALTGRRWTAAEGLEHGLVNRVVPTGTHLDEARVLAEEVLRNPPLAVRSVVQFRRGRLSQLAAQAKAVGVPYRWDQTEDFRESTSAFLEKRAPVYKGR